MKPALEKPVMLSDRDLERVVGGAAGNIGEDSGGDMPLAPPGIGVPGMGIPGAVIMGMNEKDVSFTFTGGPDGATLS